MDRRLWWGGAATLLVTVFLALLAAPEANAQNPCLGKLNCSDCIRTPTCSWCSKSGLEDSKRCFQSNRKLGCPERHIHNPSIQYRKILAQELSRGRVAGAAAGAAGAAGGKGGASVSTSSSSSSSSSSSWSSSSSSSSSSRRKIVQIYPQRVGLKLRINEAYRIKFEYAQAEDYPVDLYYLMDLSKSMEDDKDKLSTLGDLLVASMRNVTSNFRLGFGSFVDKIVMPYVSTVPKKLEHPCLGCAAPYGYRNHMSLSTNVDDFTGKVKNAAVSGNLDAPEGGFDAIMQAIVCRDEIGWRNQARRLLVFSTDAGFHYAGDGKLGGIVKPNDGECHLDGRGLYTHSTLQDYPSISQINLKVKENSINVIFAVTGEQIGIYERLKDHVEGSSAGKLSNDSSNVVDLVREQYEKITSSVEMRDNATSSIVRLRYFTSGIEGKGDNIMRENHTCEGLKVGSKVNFEVEFLAKQCPRNRADWKQTIQIYPVGIDESLIVDLELLCDCQCERENHSEFEKKSEYCNKAGDLVCGVCQCDEQHFGPRCECDSHGEGKELDGVNLCRKDNTSLVDCSGRGSCICGQCHCDAKTNPEEKVWGRFCECDNFSCNYGGGEICSGSSHGVCDCGKCLCEPGWSGDACECSTVNTTCIGPKSTDICSGRGVCKCGKCLCDLANDDGDERYGGEYCERVPLTATHCSEYQACVQCQMYQKGEFNEEECAANCTAFVPLPVDYVEANEEEGEVMCIYFDDEGCRYKFVYLYNGTDVVIRAQEKLECPPVVHFLGIIFLVVGAIVLIGLILLLLWKLLTTIHDRREFAKFEKERMLAKWDTGENPIYKQATSTFKNPTYAGK
ncbi:hypothetical protein R5R35_010140 [Gryllus longicercus]|uniref:Integrin beta n=1 Tax=Gryllus longicercus TaxID=2509291 RepID=A0AAN9VDB5_9ORTH|nr:Teneurin-m [Gryllus bimaculatus]